MNKTALLISCGNYTDPNLRPLSSSIPDCARLADLLERPTIGGFSVHIANDATLVEAQRELHDVLSSAAIDDLVLIYLSGHGLKDIFGRFYLALPDTEVSALPATALSGRFIREQMNDTLARRVIVILDSCFSGAFARDLIAKSVSLADGTPNELADGTGHAVLAASSAIQFALEDGSDNPTSVFTRTICDGIATGAADIDGDGWISLNDLFEYSSREVSARYASQTPQMSCFGLDRNLRLLQAPSSIASHAGFDQDIEVAAQSIHSQLRVAAVLVMSQIAHSQNKERAAEAIKRLRTMRNDYDPGVRELADSGLARAPRRPRRRVPIQNANEKRVEGPRWLDIAGKRLAHITQNAAEFADRTDEFPKLARVHLSHRDGHLKIWATDRYRIDVWDLRIADHGEAFDTSISSIDIFSLKAFSKNFPVRIQVGKHYTEFECEGKLITLPCMELDELPDYQRQMEQSFTVRVEVNRVHFLDCVEQVIASRGEVNEALILAGGDNDSVEISSASGRTIEHFPIQRTEKPFIIGFNPHYIASALGAFEADSVHFRFISGEYKPALLSAASEPEHRHAIMPVRLDNLV